MAWGAWSVDPAKRRRLGRAINCWRAEHPEQGDWLLQVAVAVVPCAGSDWISCADAQVFLTLWRAVRTP